MAIDRETVGSFIDACVNDQSEAKRLLNANPGLCTAGWMGDEPVLMFLATENYADAVSFCVKNGFDVDGGDNEFDDTPLHIACKLNYPDVVRVLCELGANTNAVSKIYDTPLHCCISNANPEIIEILLSSGADPNYTTALSETIFDNWPNNAEKQAKLSDTLSRHGILRNAE